MATSTLSPISTISCKLTEGEGNISPVPALVIKTTRLRTHRFNEHVPVCTEGLGGIGHRTQAFRSESDAPTTGLPTALKNMG
ncbi:hypothetical protein TNCV_4374691 [Trichonephila clavipes]|nr:hypothetical protein TNCV_4374691 [Trichonephila clavipes]